eukprot:TRINITY_DN19580_c0_g1_i12.p1 TRINITY_DN19580_c0_g1~~TRINITY_DN19580_c0_g1_i12.p1  ORF type:complete len:235 (+),score=55.08 TRINITY_DN19580_c0_g1_i12:88-792(+)
MLMTSLRALPLIAVATTVVFRNVSTLLVAGLEPCLLGSKPPTKAHIIALAVILTGALVYTFSDLNYEPHGYAWISFNSAMFVALVLLEKFIITNIDQTSVGVSCYQNSLSLPVILAGVAFGGETECVTDFQLLPFNYKILILVSGCLGCLLSLCYISLNQLMSATSVTIAGNINKLLSAVVGVAVFSSAFNMNCVLGLVLCVYGGYLYSQAGKSAPIEPPQEDEVDLLTTEVDP